MKTPQHDIDELLRRPSEGLNVEVKSWLDPDVTADIAKIVKGTFALRNRNGGFFIIGLDDKTLKPATKNKPADIRRAYHTDKIQGIISKYAASHFEIEIAFGEIDGVDIAVIVVPGGIRYPLATKGHLNDAVGKSLILFGQVYSRTLKANGIPSTAPAQPQDWEDIVEVCFENREADLGRFLRRLVGSGTGDIATLLNVIAAGRKRKSGTDDDE
jgi:predicted HTH transcriptional regulator